MRELKFSLYTLLSLLKEQEISVLINSIEDFELTEKDCDQFAPTILLDACTSLKNIKRRIIEEELEKLLFEDDLGKFTYTNKHKVNQLVAKSQAIMEIIEKLDSYVTSKNSRLFKKIEMPF